MFYHEYAISELQSNRVVINLENMPFCVYPKPKVGPILNELCLHTIYCCVSGYNKEIKLVGKTSMDVRNKIEDIFVKHHLIYSLISINLLSVEGKSAPPRVLL